MKHVLALELIGRNIEVCEASNRSLIGLKGRVLNETKNTIIIENEDTRKTLMKEQITFIVEINDKRIKIDGKKITKRPEKRL